MRHSGLQIGRTRPLLRLVADAFGVAPDELASGTRGSRQAASARQAGIYLCHVIFGMSFADAGRVFARDRTTAAYACRMIEERRDDGIVDARVSKLEVQAQRLKEADNV